MGRAGERNGIATRTAVVLLWGKLQQGRLGASSRKNREFEGILLACSLARESAVTATSPQSPRLLALLFAFIRVHSRLNRSPCRKDAKAAKLLIGDFAPLRDRSKSRVFRNTKKNEVVFLLSVIICALRLAASIRGGSLLRNATLAWLRNATLAWQASARSGRPNE
jgi:hypothetical protein